MRSKNKKTYLKSFQDSILDCVSSNNSKIKEPIVTESISSKYYKLCVQIILLSGMYHCILLYILSQIILQFRYHWTLFLYLTLLVIGKFVSLLYVDQIKLVMSSKLYLIVFLFVFLFILSILTQIQDSLVLYFTLPVMICISLLLFVVMLTIKHVQLWRSLINYSSNELWENVNFFFIFILHDLMLVFLFYLFIFN